LIKEPGVYKLDQGLVSGFSLEVQSPRAFNLINEFDSRGKKGFYAALPLVLRPGFNDDCIIDKTGRRLSFAGVRGRAEFRNIAAPSAAVDCRGVAAFIGAGPGGMIQVLCRGAGVSLGNNGDAGGPSFFVVVSHKYTGGIDA
jgi:hypothetical protein